jgi:hypothetical protein
VKIGDQVKCQRDKPARGNWKKYAGQKGTVVAVEGDEIGVSLGHGIAWFKPNELVPVKKSK